MIKKRIPWMILFFVMAVLSIWAVMAQSKSFSFEAFCMELSNIKISWFLLAILSMSGFIFFEGFAISSLVDGLVGKRKVRDGAVYAAADVYFSAITPSATGGQPASALFMIMDGINYARTTVILLVNLVMYTMALMLCGTIAILFHHDYFFTFDIPGRVLIIVGISVLLFLSGFFVMLLKDEKIIFRLGTSVINLGHKLHLIRRPARKLERLKSIVAQYKECAFAVQGKRKMLRFAFIFNLFQRVSQSMVFVFCYLAMGGSILRAFDVWSVQIMTALGSNSVPIPGAMGVADYLLLQGLDGIDGVKDVTNLELLSRGLSFYTCVLLSIIIIIIGYTERRVFMKRKEKRNHSKENH